MDLFPHRRTTPDSDGQAAARYRNAIWGVPLALAVLLVVLWLFWWYFHRPVAVPETRVTNNTNVSRPPSSPATNTSIYSPPSSAQTSVSTEPTGTEAATEASTTDNTQSTAETPTTVTQPTQTTTKVPSTTTVVKNTTTTTKTTVTPPPTYAVVSPTTPNGLNYWYNTRPTISLLPMDGRVISYRWDSSRTWLRYKSARSVPDGAHVFHFYGVVNGHKESVGNIPVYVDPYAPSMPANLRIVDKTEFTVHLAWDASKDTVSGVSHYQVYVDDILLDSPSMPETIIRNLTPGHSYSFYVKAVDTAGNVSRVSDTVKVHTDPPGTSLTTNPSAPDGTNGWFVTAPSVMLASHAPGGTVYYAWDKNLVFPPKSYTAPLAAAEGVHKLQCYSISVDGIAGPSLETTFKVDTIAPTKPVVGAVVVSPTEIDLSWSVSTDVGSGMAYYEVWDGTSLFATSTATSYKCSGLGALAAHEFYVAAVDVAGNRTLSTSPPLTPQTAGRALGRTTAAVTPTRLRIAAFSQSTNITSTPLANPPAAPPGATAIPGSAYDVTPVGPITGPQMVVISYNPAALGPNTQVRMMHYTGGAWVDVTNAVDPVARQVSGMSSTFSPFELFEVTTTSTPASSWESLTVLALVGVVIASLALRRRDDSPEPVSVQEERQ